MSPGKTTDLAQLRSQVGPGKRLLGLDIGTKTIGLAVSDGAWMLATPVETLKRGKLKQDAAALANVVAGRNVGGLVLGLPVNMDGSEGPRCQSVRQFAANISPLISLPIVFWDERLSTAAVERTLIAQDVSRRKREQVIDAHAAAYILQGALDRLATLSDSKD